MKARCPNCNEGLGEQVRKYVSDGSPVADFVCPDCDHEWALPL
ncbi:hypothetical protein C489_16685 [Natrinema versiforme JCM 10478]|uniref:Small CPxCG-related zinc finger protein n=1 Tax=Natrinema versiforme JCM 10478 TaxID=1227496 RepID=L9XSH2_9EURY|nr:hypothetical protein C489_16685 [Natrinema versiforme JCM 10478]